MDVVGHVWVSTIPPFRFLSSNHTALLTSPFLSVLRSSDPFSLCLIGHGPSIPFVLTLEVSAGGGPVSSTTT